MKQNEGGANSTGWGVLHNAASENRGGGKGRGGSKKCLARLVISLARVSLQGAKIRDSRHSARQNVQKPGSGITKKGKNGNSFCASAVSLLSPWEKSGEKFFSLWRSILGLAGEKGRGAEKGVGRKTPFGYSGKWKLALVWSQTAFRNVSGKRGKEGERRRQNLYRPPPPRQETMGPKSALFCKSRQMLDFRSILFFFFFREPTRGKDRISPFRSFPKRKCRLGGGRLDRLR